MCGELILSDSCFHSPKSPNHQMKPVNYPPPTPPPSPHLSCLSAVLHQAALHQHPHPSHSLITKPKLPHMWLHMVLAELSHLSHNTLPSTSPTLPATSHYPI